MTYHLSRHALLKATTKAVALSGMPLAARAQQAARRFDPQPGVWRTFELTTTVELKQAMGSSRVWLPVPALDTEWQRSQESSWSGNARSMKLVSDEKCGARMLLAEFDAAQADSVVQLTSRVQTMSRAVDWSRKTGAKEDPAVLKAWLQHTELMPTDGIVLDTALQVIQGAKTDVDKTRRIYDWIVASTYREPKVRGCGVGDIKSMLEMQNFGGKCGDINGLFVGLCRAADLPAREVYGIRLVPSAFGYRELSGTPSNLKCAQHCRAEVFLRDHGWVAMDPADVGKVMRLETGDWIKDADHPVVAPVRKALFGGWEGNWLGYNNAQDVVLPGSSGGRIGFFMYPQAESAQGRRDPLDPDNFKYTISAREITA